MHQRLKSAPKSGRSKRLFSSKPNLGRPKGTLVALHGGKKFNDNYSHQDCPSSFRERKHNERLIKNGAISS